MNRIARGIFSGIVFTITTLLILTSQHLMNWIKFLPEKINISTILYAGLAAFFIGFVSSVVLKSMAKEEPTNKPKSGRLTTFLRWLLYNVFGAIFTASWALFAKLGAGADFLTCMSDYGLIAFITTNTMFLIMHTIMKNSNSYLESLFLAAALAAAFYACNNYFESLSALQNQHSISVLIVGAIILALLGCFIHSQRAFDASVDKSKKPISNYIGFEASVVCTLLGVFIFGITGIGIAYGNAELALFDVIVPVIIIGALLVTNFIFANSISIATAQSKTQAPPQINIEVTPSTPHNHEAAQQPETPAAT